MFSLQIVFPRVKLKVSCLLFDPAAIPIPSMNLRVLRAAASWWRWLSSNSHNLPHCKGSSHTRFVAISNNSFVAAMACQRAILGDFQPLGIGVKGKPGHKPPRLRVQKAREEATHGSRSSSSAWSPWPSTSSALSWPTSSKGSRGPGLVVDPNRFTGTFV